MTSKSLFFRRIKQDLHQRVWFPAVLFIIAFLVMELPLVSELDRLSASAQAPYKVTSYLIKFFTVWNALVIIMTAVAAVFCAISGFSYMHSARKLDTYHSMPIKREQLFWQQYVYGILYYIVPFVIHAVICFAIGVVMGAFSMQALTNMLWFILIQLLVYLLFYSVSIAAVCMTGNMIISVLGCGVLVVYSYLLYILKMELYNTFFDTYYYNSNEQIWAFSPIHLIANLFIAADESGNSNYIYSDYTMHFVKMLIQAAVYTLIALVLYQKRPTEAAGKSIAFGFIEPIVKTMVVLPVAIVCAYIFSNLVMDDSNYVWYIFGGLFGFVISCLVMEAIFRQNPRELFAHSKQTIVNGIVVAAVFIIFRFDVFGYDYYIPTNVESYGISINNLHYLNSYDFSSSELRLEDMKLKPTENIQKLLEQAVEDSDAMYNASDSVETEHYYTSVNVKYNLENGREVYRRYVIDLYNDDVQTMLAELYNSEEYKVGAYPLLSEGWKKEYNSIEVVSAYADDDFELKEERMAKLLETYQRELKALTYEEVWNELPVAELSFMRKAAGDDYNYYDYESGYMVYGSFTQTLALLEEYGCIMEDFVTAEQIIEVEVEDWSVENEDTNGELDKVMRVVYTQEDVDKIAEIMDNIVSSSLADNFNPDLYEPRVQVTIEYKYNNKEYTRYFNFKPNSIPEWLVEELEGSIQNTEVYRSNAGEIAVAVPTFE